MSGGHFDYEQCRIRDALEHVGKDEEVRRRMPQYGTLLEDLSAILYDDLHELDYDLSGDSRIPDDVVFEQRAVGRVLEAAMRAAPDAWFPRGKWATIQAIQDRKKKP